ncbi:MAG: HAMP domain-containing sensor histidine kinase, partial [Clostridia bacterium]
SFSCKLSAPVETALGEHAAIYLWKENDAQAVALLNLRVSMLNVSLAICLLFFIVALIFSGRLTRRLRRLIGGIHKVQNGAYGAQLDIDGHDELTDIAHEFNALSVRIQETEDLRRTFVSDASHELRTPLSAIRLLTDSIIHTDDIDLATTKEFLVDIGDEIDRLTRSAERLLVLTRLDGAKDLILSPVAFNKVTAAAIATLLPYAADAHVTIEQNLSDDCTFLGDRDGAYQIVFNLVENAIKYNREDGFVRVFLFVRDGKCNLIVDDTGIGLDEAHYAHIFERFYRVDKARERTDRGGTGLGLSIVAKNVENAGGEIAVMPSVYGGTRFVVTFNQYVGGASQ